MTDPFAILDELTTAQLERIDVENNPSRVATPLALRIAEDDYDAMQVVTSFIAWWSSARDEPYSVKRQRLREAIAQRLAARRGVVQ